jgi:hypothetical protein
MPYLDERLLLSLAFIFALFLTPLSSLAADQLPADAPDLLADAAARIEKYRKANDTVDRCDSAEKEPAHIGARAGAVVLQSPRASRVKESVQPADSGHSDGPQANWRRFQSSLADATSLLAEMVGEFDQYDTAVDHHADLLQRVDLIRFVLHSHIEVDTGGRIDPARRRETDAGGQRSEDRLGDGYVGNRSVTTTSSSGSCPPRGRAG